MTDKELLMVCLIVVLRFVVWIVVNVMVVVVAASLLVGVASGLTSLAHRPEEDEPIGEYQDKDGNDIVEE